MKKHLQTTARTLLMLILGGAIAVGLSAVHADGTWNDRPMNPPQSNTPFPVTVGSTSQIKGASGSVGGLSVNEFSAAKNAQFDANTLFRGMILGKPGTDPETSTLSVGDASATVNLTATGDLHTFDDGLYSDKIMASAGTFVPVCSDASGNIILCTKPSKVMNYNAKITVYLMPAWDLSYKYSRLLYKDWWHAPLRLYVSSGTQLPEISFKWGYCHTYNNTKNNNRENTGGWFPPKGEGGDHVIPGQCIGFPKGFANLPFTVDSYTGTGGVENYYGAGSGYSGTATISAGSMFWSGLLTALPSNSNHRRTWDEKFDKKGRDTSRYGKPTKIILYDVVVPPGYTLDVSGYPGGVPVEVR